MLHCVYQLIFNGVTQKFSNTIFRPYVVKSVKRDYVPRNGTMVLRDEFGRVSCACQSITFINCKNLVQIHIFPKYSQFLCNFSVGSAILCTSSRWRYSPGWALASAIICLQVSRFLALSLHSFIPIFLRSMDTSSSHLFLGLPLRLFAYSFPYSIFLGGLRCLAFFLYAQAILFLAFNKPDNVLSLDYGF